jgi:aerobic-type carbon monoxide dehydrogenase small subunit (CoxS/CutS family)
MNESLGNEMYTLLINGQESPVVDAWVGESLLYVLRERLGLPGAKGACEQGECGSCTVLMDH